MNVRSHSNKDATLRGALLFLAACAAALATAIITASGAEGHTVTPIPAVDITMNQAQAYRHVVQTDDLLILVRFELPTDDWSNSTYVTNTSCADANDFSDLCYTSLRSGAAIQTLYSGAHEARGVALAGFRSLPRIGQGLSALYLNPGHGLTWANATYETCVEGSSSLFSPIPHSCLTLQWCPDCADPDTTPIRLDLDLVQMMLNLEEELDQPQNLFVNIDKITQTGIIFPREAFPSMRSVVPGAFFTGVSSAFNDFRPTLTPSSLQATAAAAAAASTFRSSLEDVSNEYLGAPINLVGALITVIIAASIMGGSMMVTRDVSTSALLGSLAIPVGWYLGFIPTAAIWVILALAMTLGGIWLFRRLPT